MQLTLRAVPYDYFGVTLWSVEDMSGFTYKYCDTKSDAENHIKDAQGNLDKYLGVKLNS